MNHLNEIDIAIEKYRAISESVGYLIVEIDQAEHGEDAATKTDDIEAYERQILRLKDTAEQYKQEQLDAKQAIMIAFNEYEKSKSHE